MSRSPSTTVARTRLIRLLPSSSWRLNTFPSRQHCCAAAGHALVISNRSGLSTFLQGQKAHRAQRSGLLSTKPIGPDFSAGADPWRTPPRWIQERCSLARSGRCWIPFSASAATFDSTLAHQLSWPSLREPQTIATRRCPLRAGSARWPKHRAQSTRRGSTTRTDSKRSRSLLKMPPGSSGWPPTCSSLDLRCDRGNPSPKTASASRACGRTPSLVICQSCSCESPIPASSAWPANSSVPTPIGGAAGWWRI